MISPYSTFLALDVEPAAAMRNLRGMQRKQCLGSYGFYESLDYSKSRRTSHSRGFEIVRCWMAHHQGMSLLAMANFLHDEVVQDWFHSHPRVQATELLLQEKPAATASSAQKPAPKWREPSACVDERCVSQPLRLNAKLPRGLILAALLTVSPICLAGRSAASR